ERIMEFYGLDSIHDLWPNLSVYVSGGIAFEPYRKSLEALFKQPLIYQDSYLASEGFIAYQTRPDTSAMRLILNSGLFYEFVPFNEENFNPDGTLRANPRAYAIGEVEEGVDYALLLSTCAGAWRYLIGDTIRFTDKARSEIIITGRTKHFLSICGEHLSVDNMNQAIHQTEEQLDLNVREFTVAGVRSGTHFAHRWYIGCTTGLSEEQVARTLDQQLCIVNDDYRAERDAMLQELELRMVPTHIFYEWQRQQGKMNGQSKFPRVMQKEQFAAWEAFVAQQLQAQ
ncbi:MAG: GH3 auxin-responsive promoter family protein, partial [Bacteroidota bacterium]